MVVGCVVADGSYCDLDGGKLLRVSGANEDRWVVVVVGDGRDIGSRIHRHFI